jgi:hypothetical protein
MATDRQITANRLNALKSTGSALRLPIALGTPKAPVLISNIPGRPANAQPSNPPLDRIRRNRIPAEQTHLE